ncbi:MAG: PilW family protein [Rhodanobacteraceae bacterium]
MNKRHLNNKRTNRIHAARSRHVGLSLIELMVALAISTLVALGIVQIFSASRMTYQVQEGLSRVQESGRYAVQTLQRDLRMVGYMGCGSDNERDTQASFVNHLATWSATVPGGDAVDPKYRFQRPIEAFAAADLPADLTALGLNVVAGTDVLVLRTVSEDAVPVISIARTPDNYGLDVAVASSVSDVFPSVAGNDIVYALESCRSADVFVGNLAATDVTVIGNTGLNVYLDPTVTDCNAGGNCPWDFRVSNVFLNAPVSTGGAGSKQLNAELHRAEYIVLYVAPNTDNIPSLYSRRLKRTDTALAPASDELAEGIENMQLRFGVDNNGDGQADEYRDAAAVAAGAATTVALDANWRKVVSVRVGLLVRSVDRAGVPATRSNGDARTYQVLDAPPITPTDPNDGAMRQVYETTIALRNRIFNS